MVATQRPRWTAEMTLRASPAEMPLAVARSSGVIA